MKDKPLQAGSPVMEYIQTMLAQINRGVEAEDHVLSEPVRFVLRTGVEERRDGGFDFKVLKLNSGAKESDVHTVSFVTVPKDFYEKSQEFAAKLSDAMFEDKQKRKRK